MRPIRHSTGVVVGCQFGSAAHELKTEPDDQKQERGNLNDADKEDDYEKSGYTRVRVTYEVSPQYPEMAPLAPIVGKRESALNIT